MNTPKPYQIPVPAAQGVPLNLCYITFVCLFSCGVVVRSSSFATPLTPPLTQSEKVRWTEAAHAVLRVACASPKKKSSAARGDLGMSGFLVKAPFSWVMPAVGLKNFGHIKTGCQQPILSLRNLGFAPIAVTPTKGLLTPYLAYNLAFGSAPSVAFKNLKAFELSLETPKAGQRVVVIAALPLNGGVAKTAQVTLKSVSEGSSLLRCTQILEVKDQFESLPPEEKATHPDQFQALTSAQKLCEFSKSTPSLLKGEMHETPTHRISHGRVLWADARTLIVSLADTSKDLLGGAIIDEESGRVVGLVSLPGIKDAHIELKNSIVQGMTLTANSRAFFDEALASGLWDY